MFTDMATVAIAAIVAFISFRQYLVSHDQIRHELFERRFDVYKSVQAFLSKVMKEGELDYEYLPEFYDAMQKARFLFGEDVNSYLEEIKRRAFAGKQAAISASESTGSERANHIKDEHDELRWLSDQLTQLHLKFGRYMDFTRYHVHSIRNVFQ